MAVTSSTVLTTDNDLQKKLDAHGREIIKLQRQGKDILFKLSYELYLARATCVSHQSEKTFSEWVQTYGISRSNAYRAISRWEALAPKIIGTHSFGGDDPTVGKLPPFEGFLCFAKFDDSAIDELAKPSTPTKALNAAVKIAQRGEGMTKKEAQEIIAKYSETGSGRVSATRNSGSPAKTEPDGPGAETPTGVDETDETEPETPDGPRCPNCGSTDYDSDEDGMFCSKCKESAPDSDQPAESASIVLDSLDRPIPNDFRPMNELAAAIATEGRKLDPILRKLKELAGQRGGEFLLITQIENEFKSLKGEILGACYAFECPRCKGAIGKSCKSCQGRGYWPLSKRNKLSAADKEYLGLE